MIIKVDIVVTKIVLIMNINEYWVNREINFVTAVFLHEYIIITYYCCEIIVYKIFHWVYCQLIYIQLLQQYEWYWSVTLIHGKHAAVCSLHMVWLLIFAEYLHL